MRIRQGLTLMGWALLFGIFMTLAGAGTFAIGDLVVIKGVVREGETGGWMGWILPWFELQEGQPLYCLSQGSVCGSVLPVIHIWGNFGVNIILFAAVFMIYKVVRQKRASSVEGKQK